MDVPLSVLESLWDQKIPNANNHQWIPIKEENVVRCNIAFHTITYRCIRCGAKIMMPGGEGTVPDCNEVIVSKVMDE
jgi:hypothetical protein